MTSAEFKSWLTLPETKEALKILESYTKDLWWDHRKSDVSKLQEAKGIIRGVGIAVQKIQELGEDK